MITPSRRETGVVLGVLVALVLCAHFRVSIGDDSFYHLDTYFQHAPFWHFASSAVAAGEAPWWTPNIRAGYPLHANGEASLLYPLTLPFGLIWPAHRAMSLFTLLHLIALGAFTWRFLREVGVSAGVAAFAAAAFALSGRMTASTVWPNAVAASCALPVVLLGIERCRRDGLRGALWIAAGIGLGLLAGRPQRLAPALLLAGAYALFVAFSVARSRGAASAGRLLGACAGGAALGTAIGAPQMGPTLALVADSIWADGVKRAVFEANALTRMSPTAILLPAGARSWSEGRLYPGVAIYAGLALGVVGLIRGPRDARAGFWLGAVGVCAWLALAGPLAYELCQSLPVLRSLRSPIRFLFPLSFAATALAALALDSLLRHPRVRALPRSLVAAGGAVACAELIAVCWLTAPTGPSQIYEVRPSVLDDYPVELDPVGFPYRSYASGRWIAPELVAKLPPDALLAQFRALPLTRDLAMRFGRETSNGYGEPRLAWKDRSYRRIAKVEMNQLGVRRLFMSHRLRGDDYAFEGDLHGTTFVYRNDGALPRALCVSRLRFAADADAALDAAMSRGFDPATTLILEGSGAPAEPTTGAPCVVRLEATSPTATTLRVRAGEATWLVVFDTWAPGWTARIAGDEVPVRRANGMFRAIPVPAGDSTVKLRYRPPGLLGGSIAAGLGVLGFGALLVLGRGRR